MNTLDLDKFGQCVITVPNAANEITFLDNYFFDNSIEALKKDINICDDPNQKKILLAFLDKCNVNNIFGGNEENIEEGVSSQNISVDFDDDGFRCVSVCNLEIKHSGFWYAANNIKMEIENQKKDKHTVEGFLKISKQIDEMIRFLREARSTESAIRNICDFGLTEAQAHAVCNLPLTSLAYLMEEREEERLRECISLREKIIAFLEELDI